LDSPGKRSFIAEEKEWEPDKKTAYELLPSLCIPKGVSVTRDQSIPDKRGRAGKKKKRDL